MKSIRVGSAVLNQTPLDWKGNKRRILEAINLAKKQGVKVLCLPELCLTGYGCEDSFHALSTMERSVRILNEILPYTKKLITTIGMPLLYRDCVFNTVAMVSNGELLGFVAKRFLAGDGVHYEPRWFKSWHKGVRGEVSLHNRSYPVGDLIFKIGEIRLGCEICEDGWASDRPGIEMAKKGVDLILSPSASHFSFLKNQMRMRYVQEGSRSLGVVYVFSNLLGCEAGRILYDGGALIANCGELVGRGERMSLKEVDLIAADVDLDRCRLARTRISGFEPCLQKDDELNVCVADGPRLEEENRALKPPAPPLWEDSSDLKEEEFTRCVTMGLFDYLRKTRSQGFVISISGGADSSAVACLVALTVMRAVQELGQDGVAQALGHIPEIETLPGYTGLIRKLLVCAYQATENSSENTLKAAKRLCRDLKIPFLALDVDHLYKSYVKLISGALDRQLDWRTDDLALQNIQARVRAPGIWLLANVKRALLLCTSNRSEAAVGYATMDGDTCGGLAPIGGVDKTFLRRWLFWLETSGPSDLGKFPVLRNVNELEPTAELRPTALTQRDEDDLMPYEVLDYLEKAFLVDRQSPLEIHGRLRSHFGDLYHDDQLRLWVRCFFELWSRNQWKRERYAPSFHLDDENLDPKTWCRYPILSGGFEVELGELDESGRKYLEIKTAANMEVQEKKQA
jgi:NAD+ synthase (glutamine-hydrolysing)